ncbi:uncharacterized protein LOC111731834 [Pteropus vampyrus]|uniref:Uncharacterized protein LOC111731834 n=1 Tax=Pteropus vampyrus TaxID=132908 RepID=A0A6P6BWN2_PTEVA|nr:uncharacterized protein LOC111731834 [Pteropus vampyrus]
MDSSEPPCQVSLPPSTEALSQVALFRRRVAFLGPGEPRCSPSALQGLVTGPGVRGLSLSPNPRDPRTVLLEPVPHLCSGTGPRYPAVSPEPSATVWPSLSRDSRGPRAAYVCAGAQLRTCGLCCVLGATFGRLCREGGRDRARPLEATVALVGPRLPAWDTGSCSWGQGGVKVPCFSAPQALQNRNGSTGRETCAITRRSQRFWSVWRLGLLPLPMPASKVFRNLPGADAHPG